MPSETLVNVEEEGADLQAASSGESEDSESSAAENVEGETADLQEKAPENKQEEEEEESSEEESLVPTFHVEAESLELQARLKARREKVARFDQALEEQRQRRRMIETKPEALKQKLADLRVIIPKDVREDWYERLALTTPTPVVVGDVDDDLARESAIYKATLECVVRGIEKVHGLDKLKMRPSDFYADMVKSDRHMKRVKARVLSEKKAISIVEQRRHNRGGAARKKHASKVMKGVQLEIERSRIADAKQNIRALKDWRQDAERSEATLNAAIKGKPAKSKLNLRRMRKNARFGKGGLKRFTKKNTRESTNDPSGFNRHIHAAKSFNSPQGPRRSGKKKGQKNSRPGKSKRSQTRHKRRRKGK